jgi:hypothetical protein
MIVITAGWDKVVLPSPGSYSMKIPVFQNLVTVLDANCFLYFNVICHRGHCLCQIQQQLTFGNAENRAVMYLNYCRTLYAILFRALVAIG